MGKEGDKATFYVTNFTDQLPLFRLRQAFEVCGILTDIYIARQRNTRGQEFGFVRYVNVRNKVTLAQALNNVRIYNSCVWACEAKFDRFAHNDIAPRVSNLVEKNTVIKEQPVMVFSDEGVKYVRRGNLVLGETGEGAYVWRGKQTVMGEQGLEDVTITVGDIAVNVCGEGRKKKVRTGEGACSGGLVVVGQSEAEEVERVGVGDVFTVREEKRKYVGKPVVVKQQQQVTSKYVPVYKSWEEDRLWAKSGMVATISVGDSALSLQQRIEDAGFFHIVATPMGGYSFPPF